MNEFKRFHPIVNLIYFLSVMCFCFIFMHPIVSATALVASLGYAFILKGRGAMKFLFLALIPFMLLTAVLNPLFSHEGVTVLWYFPSGNPLTLEALFYGMGASLVLGAVLSLFACFNEIMTSDKLLYLFGKISPSLSLILSMVLRFVPRFKDRIKKFSSARAGIAQNDGSVKSRAKEGIKTLSAMTAWSLESAVDTADSMKARGHGITGRTSYSIYRFDAKTIAKIIYLAFLTIYVAIGSFDGVFDFAYYPKISYTAPKPYGISVFAAYALLCFYPIIIETKEAVRWKFLKSKI